MLHEKQNLIVKNCKKKIWKKPPFFILTNECKLMMQIKWNTVPDGTSRDNNVKYLKKFS